MIAETITAETTIAETMIPAMTIPEMPTTISASLIPTTVTISAEITSSRKTPAPVPLALNPAVLWRVMAVTEVAEPETPAGDAVDLWPYRDRTVALLKRYGQASVEVGRLPSLLGREFFRSRITSYSKMSFEDIVILVLDVEMAIERLHPLHKKLIAMSVLEEFSFPEVAQLVPCPLRAVEREVPEALDRLSRMFLDGGLIRELPFGTRGEQSWGNSDIR
ncbi:MAG: hypothetical protein WCC22_09560 [Terriglobales bacterium]